MSALLKDALAIPATLVDAAQIEEHCPATMKQITNNIITEHHQAEHPVQDAQVVPARVQMIRLKPAVRNACNL